MEYGDPGYQLIVVGIIPLLSALLASSMTYFFGIKKLKRERIVTEQIDLYTSLMRYLQALPDRQDDKSTENLNSLASEFNEIYNKMFLYSPDHIIEKTRSAMNKIKKGAKMDTIRDLILILRKEFIPDTALKPDDVETIEFRA